MKRKGTAVLALAALLVGVFAVTALGRGDQASPATSATVNMSGAPPNFKFSRIPQTFKAGTVRFSLKNTSSGQVRHNFTVYRINGQSPASLRLSRSFASRDLTAGRTQTLSRRMNAGFYVAVCTIGNGFHAANRMTTAFQVQ
jgi:hypothetical protein